MRDQKNQCHKLIKLQVTMIAVVNHNIFTRKMYRSMGKVLSKLFSEFYRTGRRNPDTDTSVISRSALAQMLHFEDTCDNHQNELHKFA